jgi:putative membrane protein
MVILLARLAINILSNGVGLLAASYFLDGFKIDGVSFVVAVFLFSLSVAVLGPLVLKIALTNANFLVGGIALVTTFVGLLITNFVSDGISINGLSTWVVATLVVWVFSVLGNVLLPLILFKKTLEKK